MADKILRPQVSDLAKVGRRPVHLPGLQVGVSRAPEAQVHQGAFPADLPEFLSLRAQVPDGGDEVVPGLDQGPGTQIVGRARRPERRAEAEPAVAAHVEASVSRPAVEQVVAAVVGELHVNKAFALVPQGIEARFIRRLEGDDLLRRQALCANFRIARRVPVEAQVKLGVESVVVLGPLPAESGDGPLFVKIGSDGNIGVK